MRRKHFLWIFEKVKNVTDTPNYWTLYSADHFFLMPCAVCDAQSSTLKPLIASGEKHLTDIHFPDSWVGHHGGGISLRRQHILNFIIIHELFPFVELFVLKRLRTLVTLIGKCLALNTWKGNWGHSGGIACFMISLLNKESPTFYLPLGW